MSASRIEPLCYKNRVLQTHGYLASNCNHCGASLVLTEQMKVNQRSMADAERLEDRLLTFNQIKILRKLSPAKALCSCLALVGMR